MRSVVDLPQPDGPSSTQNAPCGTVQRKIVDDRAAVVDLLTPLDLDHRPATRRQSGEALQQEIGGQRQQDRRERAEQHEVGGILPEALEDKDAEAAGADQRRDDGEADRLHGHDAQPGDEHRRASGTSTRQKRCRAVMPMPRAASIAAGSMPPIPAVVLRTIGSSA